MKKMFGSVGSLLKKARSPKSSLSENDNAKSTDNNVSTEASMTQKTSTTNNVSLSLSHLSLTPSSPELAPIQAPEPRTYRLPSPNNDLFLQACRDTHIVYEEFAFHKNKYEYIGKILGKGSYGSVKEAVKSDEGIHVAVKEMSKERMRGKGERLRNEISILLRMSHPNILHILDWGLGRLTIYIVTELASGGELFDHIIEKGVFFETDAAHIAAVLFDAIRYCHTLGIVHRDIKPENIFFKDPTRKDYNSLVIGDFGISRLVEGDKKNLKTRIGSPGYIAPEVLMSAPYGKPADIWSLGVIIYILLAGGMPFRSTEGGYEAELAQILNTEVFFDKKTWAQLTEESKDFVQKCLTISPDERMTAEQAMNHPWLTKYGPQKFRKKLLSPAEKEERSRKRQNIFGMIKGGLDDLGSDKMKITNLVNQQVSSGSTDSLSSTGSGQTSGWGTASHSRNSSMNNDKMLYDVDSINKALAKLPK